MTHLLTTLITLITFAQVLFGNSYPHWHVSGVDEGWRDEALALQYFHNSELQRQWAWHLLARCHFAGNEAILDFGCGDGKITAELSHFIPQGHILGIDLSPAMIALASRCFPSSHYHNLAFTTSQDVDFSDEHKGEKFDLIYSLCVFHMVPNPIQILKHLRMRLVENGRLLLVIPGGYNPALFQAAPEIFDAHGLKAPWISKERSTNPITMRTIEGCTHCLQEAGFTPLSVVILHTPTAFFNKRELVEWMMGGSAKQVMLASTSYSDK